MRVRDRGIGEHTSDREGEETERQEDSENAHGCGVKGEGRGLKMEIEYKSVLIGVVDRQSLLFVWAAIAVTSTGGKKKSFQVDFTLAKTRPSTLLLSIKDAKRHERQMGKIRGGLSPETCLFSP